MAILFTSQKKQKRIFVWSVIVLETLILFGISLFIFPPQLPSGLLNNQEEVYNEYDVKINLSVMNLEQVINLEPFLENIQLEFDYSAQDKKGKKVAGIILAKSQDEAISLLAGKGLTVLNIQESHSIKEDPFAPYYQ